MRHALPSTFTGTFPLPADASASRLRTVLARATWLIGLPGRIAAARRAMAQLGAMSPGELADIGLVRQDLWDAAALPLGTTPGRLLTQRAADRRRAALAQRH